VSEMMEWGRRSEEEVGLLETAQAGANGEAGEGVWRRSGAAGRPRAAHARRIAAGAAVLLGLLLLLSAVLQGRDTGFAEPQPSSRSEREDPLEVREGKEAELVRDGLGILEPRVYEKYSSSDGLLFGEYQNDVLKNLASHPLERLVRDMDRSKDPCEHFYRFACGGWLKRSKLPNDRSSFFRSFSGTDDAIVGALRWLLHKEENRKSKVGVFYETCVEKRIGSDSQTDPSDLELVSAYFGDALTLLDAEGADARTVMRALGILHRKGLTPYFYPDVDANPNNPEMYALYIGPGGLGLPDKSYYERKGKDDLAIIDAYEDYLEYLLTLTTANRISRHGYTSRELAQEIVNMEHRLSELHPGGLSRAPETAQQTVNVEEFDANEHAFLTDYLQELGVDDIANRTVIIQFVPFFEEVGRLVDATPHAVIEAYIMCWALKFLAAKGALGPEPLERDFRFYGMLVQGQKEPTPAWRACMKEADKYFPDALGKLFVSEYFEPSAKEAAAQILRDIEAQFAQMLQENKWIDARTRKNSLEKLHHLRNQIGYPDRLDSYEDVSMNGTFGDFVLHMLARRQQSDLGLLGRSLDRNYWYMSPSTVNAYYVAMRNSMTFPAGILQPPFFHKSYPPALTYGAIGVVAGHELTHAFDDHGSRYNASGFLDKIWTNSSSVKFAERAKCLSTLYDGYEPKKLHEHVNGKLTLGENIADLGGIRTAFRAMNKYLKEHPSEKIGKKHGLDNDAQFFFVQFAQTYCYQETLSDLRIQIETDPHTPGEFRTKGVLSQYDEFAKAFHCKPGSRYNPASKCDIW